MDKDFGFVVLNPMQVSSSEIMVVLLTLFNPFERSISLEHAWQPHLNVPQTSFNARSNELIVEPRSRQLRQKPKGNDNRLKDYLCHNTPTQQLAGTTLKPTSLDCSNKNWLRSMPSVHRQLRCSKLSNQLHPPRTCLILETRQQV